MSVRAAARGSAATVAVHRHVHNSGKSAGTMDLRGMVVTVDGASERLFTVSASSKSFQVSRSDPVRSDPVRTQHNATQRSNSWAAVDRSARSLVCITAAHSRLLGNSQCTAEGIGR